MTRDETGTWRLKDFAGTVVFLLVQAALWRAVLWLSRDPGPVLLYGGLGLLGLTVVLAVWRIARSRPAFGIALAGCAVQAGLALILR